MTEPTVPPPVAVPAEATSPPTASGNQPPLADDEKVVGAAVAAVPKTTGAESKDDSVGSIPNPQRKSTTDGAGATNGSNNHNESASKGSLPNASTKNPNSDGRSDCGKSDGTSNGNSKETCQQTSRDETTHHAPSSGTTHGIHHGNRNGDERGTILAAAATAAREPIGGGTAHAAALASESVVAGIPAATEDHPDHPTQAAAPNHPVVFVSGAREALERARSLAAAAAATTTAPLPQPKEVSLEVLRDLINQNPGKFWKPPLSEGGANASDRPHLVFYQASGGSTDEPTGTRTARSDEPPAKRRRRQDPLSPPDEPPSGDPTDVDREVLAAVGGLLESKLQARDNGSSNGSAANDPMEGATPAPGTAGLARRVAASVLRDLEEVLEAVGAASGNTLPPASTQPPPPPGPVGIAPSLRCDETDLVQLRDAAEDNDDDMEEDDDDEIIEISPEDNYVQQHLICHEDERHLFGPKASPSPSDALLVAQKMALLRETQRLVRAKTLVLTKRRLAIPEEEDLSVVI